MTIIVITIIACALGLWLALRGRDARIVLHSIEDCPEVTDPRFARVLGALLSPGLLSGNRIEPLQNGNEIFPPMLRAIRAATTTICFETFVYWEGKIGREFAEALSERAAHGVRVCLLLDYIGSVSMETELLEMMQQAGCELVRFHPPSFLHPSRINNRTHRKLLVVDGRIGFTGGVGIADEWTGEAEDPDHWRDCHFRILGPVVAQLQSVFMVNWIKARGRVETAAGFFPELQTEGEDYAHMFHSSPDDGSENIRLMYLLGIRAARRTLQLTQAYFLPDELCRKALTEAAGRGVRVEIIVPGKHTDERVVRRASRGCWGELLEAGIRIHEFQPTNVHSKVIVVDSHWCCVGSANFDNRSFRLNDEANLGVLSPSLAKSLEEAFARDLARAREITLDEWSRRPLRERIAEALARRVRRIL